jgi:peptidoglycan/LPS O-acetylase OafA/YrhL
MYGDAVPEPSLLTTASRRDGALDGLRGLAIILVVLSHGWTVYAFDEIHKIAPFDSLLLAGNVAVTIFLVVSGFLVTRSMLAARDERGASGPWSTLLRRSLRISAQVLLLIFVIGIVSEVDPTDTTPQATTQKSLLRIATYTWNWFVRAHPLEARGDLGPLWYLSVEMQFYVVLAAVLAFWGARRRGLVAALAVLIVAVICWRWYSYDLEGWYSAPLRTSTRVDGLLWGALIALMMPRLQRFRSASSAVAGAAALGMLAVILSSSHFDIGAYMKLQGLFMALAVSLFVVGNHLCDRPTPIARALSWTPLRFLGSVSLTIYVWHSPVLWAVARHTGDWSNLSRTMLALAVLSVVTAMTHRYVDGPVQRWTSGIGRSAPRHAQVGSTAPAKID